MQEDMTMGKRVTGAGEAARGVRDENFDPKVYLQQGAWRDVRLGLERARELLERLGRPQDALRIVHVAGTNGKGSTCAFVAGMLQAAGYKTGLFTSPYVLRFNERIQVNRRDISDDDLFDVACAVRDVAENMEEHPTAFELITAAALLHFAQVGCEAVVLEVGLGGRLDSTNVVEPEVCAITPISIDHTRVLGSTVDAIAAEKAGIIKPGVPVVCAAQPSEAAQVVYARARELGAPVIEPRFDTLRSEAQGLHQSFSYDGIENIPLQLLGTYQPGNAAVAIEVVRALRKCGFEVSDEHIREGISATRWQGRFEVVAASPVTIVDGGHNAQGARALADTLTQYFPGGGVTFVMSVLRDKDYRSMLSSVLPLATRLFCSEPPGSERALHADELAHVARDMAAEQGGDARSLEVRAFGRIQDAVTAARMAAGPDGVVCCFGSLYSVEAIMEALR